MTEPSPKMRPAPREPSKQLKANSFPATNRRAASALMVSAEAEPAATKTAARIANRAIIPIPLPLPSRRPRNRRLTI
jgi:hypothetical protein